MAQKKKTDWESLSTRPGAAVDDDQPAQSEELDFAEPSSEALPAGRGPKVAKTYRISEGAVTALNAAVGQAMMRGERLSREDAVEAAIWSAYGHLVQQKTD